MNAIIRLEQHVLTEEIHLVRELSALLASLFVRHEQRFYHVDSPNCLLSRRDLEQSFLIIVNKCIDRPEQVTPQVLRKVYEIAIERKHTDRARSIPVWGRTVACHPGSNERVIFQSTGVVELNTWKVPAYRSVKPADNASVQVFSDFFYLPLSSP